MSRVRIDFLNWRPDIDDFPNDGLVTADNCVHEPEGYKPIYLATTTATTGGLASVTSLVARPIGPQSDLLCAWIADDVVNVGVNGVTATTSSTIEAAASIVSGSGVITAFDACELGGATFFTVEASWLTLAGNTGTSVAGYATI